MVFRKKKVEDDKQEADAEELKKRIAEKEKELLELEKGESSGEQQEETEKVPEQKVVQVPVILTKDDINRMVYENNIMLRELLLYVKEEEKK